MQIAKTIKTGFTSDESNISYSYSCIGIVTAAVEKLQNINTDFQFLSLPNSMGTHLYSFDRTLFWNFLLCMWHNFMRLPLPPPPPSTHNKAASERGDDISAGADVNFATDRARPSGGTYHGLSQLSRRVKRLSQPPSSWNCHIFTGVALPQTCRCEKPPQSLSVTQEAGSTWRCWRWWSWCWWWTCWKKWSQYDYPMSIHCLEIWGKNRKRKLEKWNE